MPKVTQTSSRKADHIQINLDKDVRSGLTSGLEEYQFIHQALPELNLEDVDITFSLFGRRLNAPILISSMTGGTEQAGNINRTLAEAAQETGIAMGIGSQRAAIENPELSDTFQVRQVAPDLKPDHIHSALLPARNDEETHQVYFRSTDLSKEKVRDVHPRTFLLLVTDATRTPRLPGRLLWLHGGRATGWLSPTGPTQFPARAPHHPSRT